jgi:hypothetical protein
MFIYRVGQNHKYTVYIRDFWWGNHQLYGHVRCIYMNPKMYWSNVDPLAKKGNIS